MKFNRTFLIAVLSPAFVLTAAAQSPSLAPPPPAAGAAAPQFPAESTRTQTGSQATHSSRVSAVFYGPQGEVQAITLRSGVSISLPPDLAVRLQSNVTKGARVQVSGAQQVIAGQTSMIAQSITLNGQTFVAAPPTPIRDSGIAARSPVPPPPPGGPLDLRGPRGRRGPDGPAPPRADGAASPPPPTGADAPPPPPDGAVPPPSPPATTTPTVPPQI